MAAAAADSAGRRAGLPGRPPAADGHRPGPRRRQGPVGDGGRRLRRARVVRRPRQPDLARRLRRLRLEPRRAAGRPGSSARSRPGPTSSRPGRSALPPRPPCSCRTTFAGDARYAYVQGTSMATPMVAAIGALVRHLNPDLTAADIVRLIKETARRPAGVWTDDLGWGILDAGAALTRAREHRPPRADLARQAPAARARPSARSPCAGRRPTRLRRACARRGSPATSSGARPTAGRFKRLFTTHPHLAAVTLRRGGRYRFYTVAVDHAGNREPAAQAGRRSAPAAPLGLRRLALCLAPLMRAREGQQLVQRGLDALGDARRGRAARRSRRAGRSSSGRCRT